MNRLRLIILITIACGVVTSIYCMPQSGRVVFEGEDRRNHRRRKRPCRGKNTDGRTFFDVDFSTLNNNYYYICGGQVPNIQDNSGNGGHQQGGGLFQGGHSQGGFLQGLFQGQHSGNSQAGHLQDSSSSSGSSSLNRPAPILSDEYDRPDAGNAGNTIVSVAEGVQNTVVGVTNAVTDTIQDIVSPNRGFFFGLFDGSLINNFFSQRPSSSPPLTTTQEPVKPVSEIYDDVQPDPYQNYHQNYKPGLNVISNNPLNNQYTVGTIDLKPSNIVQQLSKGVENIINPFLELLY